MKWTPKPDPVNRRPPTACRFISQNSLASTSISCERRLSVTFSADYLLDCIASNLPRPSEGVMPVPHAVLVGAAQADTLTQDVRSLAWMVTKKLDSHEMVGKRGNLVPAMGGATCLGELVSARYRDLCQKTIRSPLVRAADDVKGGVLPQNCSHLMRGSIAARFCSVRQGGVQSSAQYDFYIPGISSITRLYS